MAGPIIQISRYPNRRLYDRTHSRHVTQEELYDMVVSGATVQITDSATGHDITSQVLLQLMIERDPTKLAALPAEVMHLMLRSSETMLRSFFAQAMQQMFQSMFAAMPGMGGAVGMGGIPGVSGVAGAGTWPFAWPGMGGHEHGHPPTAAEARGAGSTAHGAAANDLKARIEEMTAQLDELRRSAAKRPGV
ncbi:MAG TPA: polyhydroxyalkanoate synthesis regulator DNA-binding domain-containing protein [Phycisphaerales bacterium]|nr:polyhydroxyalkanoate synthesis regulator DNA-binding domain-containing protein [Phycisphaerales bacterium]